MRDDSHEEIDGATHAWVCACGFSQYQCNDKQESGGCLMQDDEPEGDDGKTRAELLGVDPALWDHGTQADMD